MEKSKAKEETMTQAVRRLSAKIERQTDNVKKAGLHYERGQVYYTYENWHNAEKDFSQAIALNPQDSTYWAYRACTYEALNKYDEAIADLTKAIGITPDSVYYYGRGVMYKLAEEYEKALPDIQQAIRMCDNNEEMAVMKQKARQVADEIQKTKTFEERLAPYRLKINLLKEDPELPIFETVIITQDYRELLAVMTLLEEYDLLERFFKEYGRRYLNERLNVEFAWWEPTPLYFITGNKSMEIIKDLPAMLRYLVDNGADVNLTAGDGSTPLWNQTTNAGKPEILQTLLELGANPNQMSTDDEDNENYPLQCCLLPIPDENDENILLPYDALAIEKATLLLNHGADPNLSDTKAWNDYPPLVLAILNGPNTAENRELIKLLLQKGANPNFTDSEEYTPLIHAENNDLAEVKDLLLSFIKK